VTVRDLLISRRSRFWSHHWRWLVPLLLLVALGAAACLPRLVRAAWSAYVVFERGGTIVDARVGMTESEVRKCCGEPGRVEYFIVSEAHGRLRVRLGDYQAAKGCATQVCEKLYEYDGGDCEWVWFVRNEDGAWVVFASLWASRWVDL
jgi:hypothetical protein